MILYSVIITMVLFTLQGVGLPQDKQQKDDFQKKVDDAIDRGAEFLSKNGLRKQGGQQQRYDVLALYALVHADREKDKKLLEATFASITADKKTTYGTYDGSIIAMALALYSDAKKYKPSLEGIVDSLMKGMDEYGGWG